MRSTQAKCAGFTLLEVLVATGIVLLLAAGVLMVAIPSHGSFRLQPAALNIQQRVRTAADSLQGAVLTAGSGPVNHVFGLPLGAVVPSLLPYRIGLRRADPPGTFRSDVLTSLRAEPRMAAAGIAAEFQGASGTISIVCLPGCPVGHAACGLQEGSAVLLVDVSGQWDLYGVSSVVVAQVRLEARGVSSGRRYTSSARVLPVEIDTYYLRSGVPDGPQLAHYDGYQSDLPLVDHVASFKVEHFGEATPPQLRTSAGGTGGVMTYGPAPPLPGEDDGRDSWGAGENCVVALAAGHQVSRLEAWSPGESLVLLSPGQLTDGPWCPDVSSPARFDADLLRVRRVRITLRAEAWHESLRGGDPRLFLRPGTSARPEVAPDEQVTLDLVPRALGMGR